MKEKKFLELLNLYLDGAIDPAGAAELEQEITSNPARRRIYNDYCRIHRATRLIYEHFRAAGAAQAEEALPASRRGRFAATAGRMSMPEGRTGGRATLRPFRTVVFVGGLAAACAIGLFIGSQALAPRPADEPQAAPAAAIAVSTSPAPAAEVPSATEPVTVESTATFAAPFAPVVRDDPYVQLPRTPVDPFALTSWTDSSEDFSELMPAPALSTPALDVDPRFRPAVQGLDAFPGAKASEEKNPFREKSIEKAATGRAAAPTREISVQP